jgi:hypothetical protein
VSASPDRPIVVRAGGAALVPGECMSAPERRGGRLRVEVDDGRGAPTRAGWVRVRRGTATTVALVEGEIRTLERRRCDAP